MKTKLCLLLSVFIISCPSKSSPKTVKIDSNEQWLGIYLKQSKIGYSFNQIQKLNNNYKLVNRVKLNLSMLGQPEAVTSYFSTIVDTNLTMQEFDFSFQSQSRSFSAQGSVNNHQLLITIKSGGISKKETREITEPVYPVTALGYLAVKRNFQPGKKYSVKGFDATIMSVFDTEIEVIGKEKLTLNNKAYKLTKMNISYLGITNTIWIDDNGLSRKEISPPGLVSIEETREQALAQEGTVAKLDILSLFSIPTDTIIPEPRRLKYLKLQISNIDTTGLNLIDDFQKILGTGPLTIEINITDQLKDVPMPIKDFNEYLKPTLYVQSDNLEIKKQAQEIVGSEKSATKVVEKIMQWVYRNVQKRATASLPSAIDVLKNLEGDCNEHAVLFAALGRALGIPTQICVGLVYVDGKFYYHAWNKVYLDKWIPVDATFGQLPVDATHIKFAEGELEEQTKVLKIVGEIKINIVAFH